MGISPIMRSRRLKYGAKRFSHWSSAGIRILQPEYFSDHPYQKGFIWLWAVLAWFMV